MDFLFRPMMSRPIWALRFLGHESRLACCMPSFHVELCHAPHSSVRVQISRFQYLPRFCAHSLAQVTLMRVAETLFNLSEVCVVDAGQALFQLAQGLMAFNAASTACPDDESFLSAKARFRWTCRDFMRMALARYPQAHGRKFCSWYTGYTWQLSRDTPLESTRSTWVVTCCRKFI